MSMRINQNVLSMSTYANLNRAGNGLENSISKLSSGLRINSAADDAAGLAISEKMRRQIKGLERAELNAQDGISMIQTAEGALSETQSIIQRMRELALQSANDTLTSNDRLEIQNEVEELKTQIDSIAESTEFNTKKLLNGNQAALVTSSSQAISGYVSGTVKANGDYNISLATISGGISQMQRSQILRDNSGSLSTGSSKLQDIGAFYGASGEFSLETPQTLTLTGNGKTTTITLDSQMSLNEVAASFQNALSAQSGLGISNSKVQVMTESLTGEPGNGGYLQITSGSIGDNGEFNIAGSQDVLDALGFSVTREAVNSMVSVSMKDAYGNSKSITTSTDKASALLDGIDIQFKSQAAQVAGQVGIVDGLKFDSAENLSLKVGELTATLDITIAAGNWSMDGIARSINSQIQASSSFKDKGLSASVVDGEIRLNYSPTGENADNTAINITAESNTLGIRTGEYNGFVTGAKDSSKAIQGISKYSDTRLKAKETLDAAKADVTAVMTYGDTTTAAYSAVRNLTGNKLSSILTAIIKDISANTTTTYDTEINKVSSTIATAGAFSAASAADLDAVADAMEALAEKVGSSLVDVTSQYNSSPATTPADVADAQAAFSSLISNATKAIRAQANAVDADKLNVKISDGDGDVATAAISYDTLSAATDADLKEIESFVASVNSTLANKNVDVRADVVNGSMVFTSTQVGTNADGVKSAVKLDVDSGASLANSLGFKSGTAYGSGDTNFKMHVVNTQAQLQIGADAGDNMKFGIADMSTKALGLDKIDLTSVAGAEKSLEKLNQALDKVSSERSKLGAYQNRLEYTISNLQNTNTNLTSAESRIRDVDMAKEMIMYTRNQIVTQAATSMLAQANSIPQNALSLLG
ncbi:MAG: flagellin [Candidatus Ozemobacteraceae bacterium]